MDTLVKWTDPNFVEQGYNVYRSATPIDPENLPDPIAELGPSITEYVDSDTVAGQQYHYAIGAKYRDEVRPKWVSPSKPILGGNASMYLDFMSDVYSRTYDFARLSEATFDPNGGNLITVPQNVLRRDGRGALLERAATNLCPNSHTFGSESGWSTNSGETTAEYDIDAPDGSDTAVRVAGTAGQNRFSRSGITAPLNGSTITTSVWMRLVSGGGFVQLYTPAASGTTNIRPQLIEGEWVRVVLTEVVTNGNVNLQVRPSTGTTVDVWGWQVEESSIATSYIPTGSATATRAADFLTVPVHGGGRVIVFEWDKRDVNVGGNHRIVGWYSSPQERSLLSLRANDELDLTRVRSGASNVSSTRLSVAGMDKLTAYMVLADDSMRLGVVGVGETAPLNANGLNTISNLAIGGEGYTSSSNTNMIAHRLVEVPVSRFSNAADAFAWGQSLAQEWAA